MGKSLWDQLQKSEPAFLQRFAFEVIRDEYVPESFGNSLADLQSPDLRVRLIHDRGDLIAYVLPFSEINTELLLLYVLQVLHPDFQWSTPVQSYQRLNEVCRQIEANYEKIANLLKPMSLQDTKRQVDELARKRLAAMGIHIN